MQRKSPPSMQVLAVGVSPKYPSRHSIGIHLCRLGLERGLGSAVASRAGCQRYLGNRR